MPSKNPSNLWHALSIRARLSIGYAATLSLLLLVYAAFVYVAGRERFGVEINHRLDQEVEIAERSLARDEAGNLVWRPPHDSTDDYQIHCASTTRSHRTRQSHPRKGNAMKNAGLSWAVRGLAALVISVVCLPTTSWAQAKVDQKPAGAVEWKSVADVFGFPGENGS
jgi:hypothetical protein